MPRLALGDEEVTIARWHKNIGDRTETGELILEVDTDKATMEVEAPFAGVIEEILHTSGATVRSGETLARFSVSEEAYDGSTEPNSRVADSAPTTGLPAPGSIGGLPGRSSQAVAPRTTRDDLDIAAAGPFSSQSLSRRRLAVSRIMSISAAIPQFSMTSYVTHPLLRRQHFLLRHPGCRRSPGWARMPDGQCLDIR